MPWSQTFALDCTSYVALGWQLPVLELLKPHFATLSPSAVTLRKIPLRSYDEFSRLSSFFYSTYLPWAGIL